MAGEGGLGTAEMAEAQYVTAKTAVWWDIENCGVPKGVDANGIAQNINYALLKMNYCGPVSISAFGDTNGIPPTIQQALNSTGIMLNHVPAGVKDASDKKILVDMLFWAVDNPAPANFMLISGDRDFSNALHQLRMRRYNILLAQPQNASAPLIHAARTVWLWTSLSTGGSPLTRSRSSQLVANLTTSPQNHHPYSRRPGPSLVRQHNPNHDPPRPVSSPVRQPNPNHDPPRPVPSPVRQPNLNPNPDPSRSNGNRIPNQAQNYCPNAARPCTCSRQLRCGNFIFHPPSEKILVLVLSFLVFMIIMMP